MAALLPARDGRPYEHCCTLESAAWQRRSDTSRLPIVLARPLSARTKILLGLFLLFEPGRYGLVQANDAKKPLRLCARRIHQFAMDQPSTPIQG
jgi:hypothetical protein